MMPPVFCGRPRSPNVARTLYASKGSRLATKLNPRLLVNRTFSSVYPLPTDGLIPAPSSNPFLSASVAGPLGLVLAGTAQARSHRGLPELPSSSTARLSGAPVTYFSTKKNDAACQHVGPRLERAHTPAPACTPSCFGYRNLNPESTALNMQSPAVSRSRHLTVKAYASMEL